MIGYINSSEVPTLTFFEKLSYFTPMNLYNAFDELSREVLFTFANDYHLGLPVAVILISFLMRTSYL